SRAVGMFFSPISRDERRAMVLAVCIVLFFTAGMPLFGALICQSARSWEYYKDFLIFSPGFACYAAFEQIRTFTPVATRWTVSMILIHGMSWLLLILACLIVPRTWQDKAASPAAMRRREKLQRLEHGSSEVRRASRRRLLEINPF